MLTVDDVRNKDFTTTRLREGYDQTEVDAFLDRVEDTINQLLDMAREKQGDSAARILIHAQATADQVVAQAKRDGEKIVADARVEAEAARKDAIDRQHAEIGALESIRSELESKISHLEQTHATHTDRIAALVESLSKVLPTEATTQVIEKVGGE